MPAGLPQRIDLGTLSWGAGVSRDVRLTWNEHAPYRLKAEATAPLRVSVTESKALPGRFIVSLSIDWDSDELSHMPSMRGYTLDGALTLHWASGGEAQVRVRGVLLYPPLVTVSPESLDLGTVRLGARSRTSFVLVSNAPTDTTVEPPPWLVRVGGDGNALERSVRLAANTPFRVTFEVEWAPIRARGAASIRAGRPVRPTGIIAVRWDGGETTVPVAVIAEPPPARTS
jgi:hypothetical protein